jgi:SpoVK/Ycf46/Vps4 family AAA+-type ATPase
MAPCVAMIDEVEKAFAGMNGNGDSGVASRMFGTFLSWLNDHESDVFVVCTANDVSKLPPEFSRSERFDGVFFLDLPSREEKDAIWKIYRDLYEVDPEQRVPDDTNWTGAEIKSCCRLSALLDLPLKQAAQNVVPVAVTASESMSRLQTWASGRCLSASQSGVYRQTNASSKTRRRVKREPSNN